MVKYDTEFQALAVDELHLLPISCQRVVGLLRVQNPNSVDGKADSLLIEFVG